MIDADVSKILRDEGAVETYEYNGIPEFGAEIRFSSPLTMTAEISAADQKLFAKGEFHAQVHANCDRCLKEMTVDVDQTFDEVFVPSTERQDEYYTYGGNKLSFDKFVYDSILLDMPTQLLCKEDCKGICSQCGQDLNTGDCDCSKEQPDETNPFAKLKELF